MQNKKYLIMGGIGIVVLGYLFIVKKKSVSSTTSNGQILVPTAEPPTSQTSISGSTSGMNYPGTLPNLTQIGPGLVMTTGPGGTAYYEPLSTSSANPTVFG